MIPCADGVAQERFPTEGDDEDQHYVVIGLEIAEASLLGPAEGSKADDEYADAEIDACLDEDRIDACGGHGR